MKKKLLILTAVLVFVLAFSVLTANAETVASGTCGDNLTWLLDDEGTLTISGTGNMTNWEWYDDVPWANYRYAISTIVVENDVTSIGEWAFSLCDSATSVHIGDSVAIIGESAFYNCIALTDVSVPDSVTEIGKTAFHYCYNLENLTLGNNLITIGESAFYSCENLLSVNIPDSVKTIGQGAFSDCYALKNLNLGCGITSIEGCAFFYCYSLESIVIPDSVISIGVEAFYACENLGTVTIGTGTEFIGDKAFNQCLDLTDISVNENNSHYSTDDYGVLFDKNKTKLIQYPTGNLRTDYSVPEGVKIICDYAFDASESLKNTSISDSVTTIGERAFNYCQMLTNVSFGKSLASIGAYAFNECKSLSVVEIPEKTEEIGNYSFYMCKNFTKLIVYSDNISFYENAFLSVPSGMIVYGYAGSTAESFANKYSFTFVELEKETEEDTETEPAIDGTFVTLSAGDGIKVNCVGITENNLIIVALFKDEKFVKALSAVYVGEEETFTADVAFDEAKIMAWDSFGCLNSCCKSVVLSK